MRPGFFASHSHRPSLRHRRIVVYTGPATGLE